MLNPVFLLLIDYLKFRVELAQLRDCAYPWRIVRSDRGALEALVEDATAQPEALRVVGRVEDAALDLAELAMVPSRWHDTHLHEVQYPLAWDCHCAQ